MFADAELGAEGGGKPSAEVNDVGVRKGLVCSGVDVDGLC